MSATITFKRGGTFSYGCNLTLPAGTWSAACQIRDGRGNLVESLSVTLTPFSPVPPSTDNHTLLLVGTSTQTADWPIELLYGDVKFTDASVTPAVVHTGTFTIKMSERITA